jgi:hypothetical protein
MQSHIERHFFGSWMAYEWLITIRLHRLAGD